MIRFATSTDLPAIVAIYNEAVAHGRTADTIPLPLASRQDWLAQHPEDHYPVYVYTVANEVVGWLSLSAWRPGRQALFGVAEVSYFVRMDHHRQGVATSLLQYALQQAPPLGIQHLLAILLADNVPSIDLLKKFGFLQWGQLPGVARFGEQYKDQLIYGLSL